VTSVQDQREAAILPEGLQEGIGHAVPFVLSRQPITEDSFTARAVEASLGAIASALAKPGTPNLLTLAKLLGAAYFVGQVSASADTQFQHELGRTPVLIVHSIDVLGGSGRVIGKPEAGGPNTTRWSSSSIFVRATVAGRYAFFVI
jgi:hypothetical protein